MTAPSRAERVRSERPATVTREWQGAILGPDAGLGERAIGRRAPEAAPGTPAGGPTP